VLSWNKPRGLQGVLGIPVEDLLAAQNIDDPNGSHPCLHGGNWNFLPTEGMVEPN
jgi:hypothetical protein